MWGNIHSLPFFYIWDNLPCKSPNLDPKSDTVGYRMVPSEKPPCSLPAHLSFMLMQNYAFPLYLVSFSFFFSILLNFIYLFSMSILSQQTHSTGTKMPSIGPLPGDPPSFPTPPRQRKVLFETEPRTVIMPTKSLSPVVPRSRARPNTTVNPSSQAHLKIPNYPLPTFSHVKSKIGSKDNRKRQPKFVSKEEAIEKRTRRVPQGSKRRPSYIPLRKKQPTEVQPISTTLQNPSFSSSSSSSSSSTVSHSPPNPAGSTGVSVRAVSARPRVISFNIHQNTSGIVRLTAELCDLNLDIKEHPSSQ
ncbi:hypothetical protein CLU79DRAFT_759707 [Phycomyces nitens]|nr:hypothetical protein CLU79DRAFT_759707 [Phycomyces nitens]